LATPAAGATRPSARLLITGEGHSQDDSHDHQAQQNGSGGKEEVAFDHPGRSLKGGTSRLGG
jgi:hypothetical protein